MTPDTRAKMGENWRCGCRADETVESGTRFGGNVPRRHRDSISVRGRYFGASLRAIGSMRAINCLSSRATTIRGLTIVELMAVIAIMAMLFGAAFALMKQMGRTNELTATTLEIKSLLNRARATALAQRTRVELGVEMDTRSGRIFTHLRRTITHFHFENSLDDGSDFTVGTGPNRRAELRRAHIVALGRTGQGVAFVGSEASRLEMPTDSTFDCPDGVCLEADVMLTGLPGAAMLIGRGSSYYLGIDDQGRLIGGGQFDGTMHLPPPPGSSEIRTAANEIRVISLDPLPPRRWVHVEMVLDRRGIRLYVDNVPMVTFIEGVETEADVRRREDELADWRGPVSDDPDASLADLGLPPETFDPNTGIIWVYLNAEGRLDPQYHTRPVEFYLERAPQTDALLQPPSRSPVFRIRPTAEALIVGAGVLGRMDNVRISRLQSDDPLQLSQNLHIVHQPDPTANRERRKIAVELMGTVR